MDNILSAWVALGRLGLLLRPDIGDLGRLSMVCVEIYPELWI
jgi:hypothetical protein